MPVTEIPFQDTNHVKGAIFDPPDEKCPSFLVTKNSAKNQQHSNCKSRDSVTRSFLCHRVIMKTTQAILKKIWHFFLDYVRTALKKTIIFLKSVTSS
jgi:hypothetical protein